MLRRKVWYVRYRGVEIGLSHCDDQLVGLNDLEEGEVFIELSVQHTVEKILY
jgi:hypothetical protein